MVDLRMVNFFNVMMWNFMVMFKMVWIIVVNFYMVMFFNVRFFMVDHFIHMRVHIKES